MRYGTESDGRVVWVNTASGCIGRFGMNGIDIHREQKEQGTLGQCLFCPHEPTTEADWDRFVVKMRELHHVEVPSGMKPDRFTK